MSPTRSWQRTLDQMEAGEAQPGSLTRQTPDEFAEEFLSSPRGQACVTQADAIEAAKEMLCARYGTDAWRLARVQLEVALACAWNRRTEERQRERAVSVADGWKRMSKADLVRTLATMYEHLERGERVMARDQHRDGGAIWFDFGGLEQCVKMALGAARAVKNG